MFTGIISHRGLFRGYRHGKQEMFLTASSLFSKMKEGESLAVNGVCLSLVKKEKSLLYFNLSEETLKKSTLGLLHPSDNLNLELPLTLSQPLSGHLVTGHIDAVGKVLNIKTKRNGKRFSISFPSQLKPFFIQKGSVALDGVSLTVADLSPPSFDVEIIPITLKNTNINDWKRGRAVNIECDIIGKYVYNYSVEQK
jgi:riboflavin synthase